MTYYYTKLDHIINHRLVLCARLAVYIENGSDVHGQPWTNSKISIHATG